MEQTLLRPVPTLAPPTRHEARRERRRLVARDRLSARLAELETIAQLLHRAAVRVEAAWCRDRWLQPVVGAEAGVCLVSAIRMSGYDPRSQVVGRAVDVAWATLVDDAVGLRWVPPPAVRLARVRDLARWNDRRDRTSDQVADLLRRAALTATGERRRLLAVAG